MLINHKTYHELNFDLDHGHIQDGLVRLGCKDQLHIKVGQKGASSHHHGGVGPIIDMRGDDLIRWDWMTPRHVISKDM